MNSTRRRERSWSIASCTPPCFIRGIMASSRRHCRPTAILATCWSLRRCRWCPGAIVRCRPVGALLMEDEAGRDEKIIAVPVDALAPFYADIRNYRDLPPIMCEQIAHFFQHYKDLEKGKWVTIVKWLDVTGAEKLVLEAIARAEKGRVGRRARRARKLATGARPEARSKR